MTERKPLVFNPPPGWPKPPAGWVAPKGWTPDPSWPAPPPDWQLWIAGDEEGGEKSSEDALGQARPIRAPTESTPSIALAMADQRIALLETENRELRARLEAIADNSERAVALDDERVLQDVGIYRYHHPLENAVAYQERLDDLSRRIAEMVKADTAIEKSNMFTFDGSLAKGRKMTRELAKLMLRAFNAETDAAVRSLRVGNALTAKGRLDNSRRAIANLGRMMEMHISDDFFALRIEEIELTSDYLMKKQEEREAAREERERLREEAKVAAELAAQREQLAKERNHLAIAIEKLHEIGSGDPELEVRLAEVNVAIAQNDFRAANIRAGYVYVISNRGAFGEHVVKIGLTRRLEPLERIYELGDASVPFRFDVHALYFSEDAVTLENELHEHFAGRRLNWANLRREFFFADPMDVRSVLAEKVGNLLEFADHAESTEFLQSVHRWPDGIRPGGRQGHE